MLEFIMNTLSIAAPILSAVFTFVPESILPSFQVVTNDFLSWYEPLAGKAEDVNTILSRAVLVLAVWCFAAILHLLHIILRTKTLIKGDNYHIVIQYGNLFKYRHGKKVVNFDECFTSTVGGKPNEVKPKSVCGQFLQKNATIDVKRIVKNSGLKPNGYSKYKNTPSYESGRLVPYNDYLLMAFAKLNADGKGVFDSKKDYLRCLEVFWEELDKYHGLEDVYIPVLGSGLTRFEGGSGKLINTQEMLDLIIWSYRLNSPKIKSPRCLHIVCRREKGFSLNKINKG